MKLLSLTLKNFRCFKEEYFSFSQNNTIIIQGENGSGKTSVLEAIYFLSFLRSFRTSHLDDLSFNATSEPFFISAQFLDDHDVLHELSVAYSEKKKHILLDKKKPTTLKELFFAFPVFSITENDLDLIKGEPEHRRTFFDGTIAFRHPEYKKDLRDLKLAIAQRNALLSQIRDVHESRELGIEKAAESELQRSLSIWTHHLWTITCKVERARGLIIRDFETKIETALQNKFKDENLQIELKYRSKNRTAEGFEEFKNEIKRKEAAEIALGRSLFGAHLDDIEIIFSSKNARSFASRGQQKLVIFLLKFTQYLLLKQDATKQGILLLDDFITDFDKKNLEKALNIIKEEHLQTILTCPFKSHEIFPAENQAEIISFFQKKEPIKE